MITEKVRFFQLPTAISAAITAKHNMLKKVNILPNMILKYDLVVLTVLWLIRPCC